MVGRQRCSRRNRNPELTVSHASVKQSGRTGSVRGLSSQYIDYTSKYVI